MKHSNVIRSALAAIALIGASLAHATDWSLNVLEGCGGQISGTFSTDSEGRVTSANLQLTGGSCSVPEGGIRYDSSADNPITVISSKYFAISSSTIGGQADRSDALYLQFEKPLNKATGYNSLVYRRGGPFGGLTTTRIDRYADLIFVAGYAVPVRGAEAATAP